MEIMVEAGPSVPTPAPTMVIPAPVFIEGAIVVTGDLWDTKLAATGGCDPDGCVPLNTRVSAVRPMVPRALAHLAAVQLHGTYDTRFANGLIFRLERRREGGGEGGCLLSTAP